MLPTFEIRLPAADAAYMAVKAAAMRRDVIARHGNAG